MGFSLLLADADAALLGDGVGVDAIHIFRALQQARDGRIAHQICFCFSERAAVDQIDGLDAAFAGLRKKRTETASHVDERRELFVLLVSERRQVDRILHHTELEIVAHLGGDLNADGLLRLARGAGDVRGEDDVVHGEVGRLFGGLDGENIKRRAGHMAAQERGDQGRIFNQLAARAVDDAHALLHFCESAFVDDAGGLGREAHVEREVV